MIPGQQAPERSPLTARAAVLWIALLLGVVYAVAAAILTIFHLAPNAMNPDLPPRDGAFGFSAAEWSAGFAFAWPRAGLSVLGVLAACLLGAGLGWFRRRLARPS